MSTVHTPRASTRTVRTAAVLAAACSLVAVAQTRAETKTFSDTATDWLDPGNWTPTGVPTATDDVLIDAGTADMTINANSLTIQHITYSNTANRLLGNTDTATPSTLTLDGDGVNPLISVTDTGVFTLQGAATGFGALGLVLNNSGSFDVANAAGQLNISSIISEVGVPRSITKTGAGTMTLTGANTFTGAVNIGATNGIDSGGVLVATDDNRFGAVPAAVTANMINLYNGTLRLRDGTTPVISAGTSVPAGTLGVSINLNRGMSLNSGNGKIDVPTGQYAEITSIIADGPSGTSPLHKIGGGIFDLRTGNHTFTGGTIVQEGTLGVNKDANFGDPLLLTTPDPDNITLDGGTIKFYSNSQGSGPAFNANRGIFVTANGGTLTMAQSSGAPQLTNVISGPGKLVVDGPRTLVVGVAQTFSGGLDVNRGRWNVQVSDAAGTGTIHLNAPDEPQASGNGVAQLGIGAPTGSTGNFTPVLTNDIVLNPIGQGIVSFEVVHHANTNVLTLNGQISGNAPLIKGAVTGTQGTLVLGGNNTYTGATDIRLGVLRVAGGSAIPDGSTVIMANAAGNSIPVRLDLDGSSETIGGLSGGGATGGNVSLGAGTLTINQAANTAYAGVISGTGGIVKSGAGTLTVLRGNTYTGNTTMAGGILAVNAADRVGDAANTLVFDGGTLQTNADVTFARNATVNAGGGTFDSVTFNSSVNNVTGAGGLTKAGTGTLTAAQVKVGGAVAVNGGTLAIPTNGTASGMVEASSLNVAPGALLAMNDNDFIVDYTGTSPEFTLRDYVKAIYQGGTSGISYTVGAGDTAIAVAERTEWGFSEFNGVALDTTAIVGKYTYFGDANLDGKVTSDDYVAVDVGLGTGDSWVQGDFNFSGTVTSDDYVAIDVNLGKGSPTPLAFAELKAEMIALHTAMFGDEYVQKLAEVEAEGFVALVPEPGALSLVGLGAIGMLNRRRRVAR